MEKLGAFFVATWLFITPCYAVLIRPVGYARIPAQTKFEKTEVGGLSGIVYEDSTKLLWAVSDDRGRLNEPRIYSLKIDFDKMIPSKFSFLPVQIDSVVTLQVQEGELSHSGKKKSSKEFSQVMDLEGISLLPWGDFLLINEGDGSKSPRIPPQVFSVKRDGVIVKSYDVPADFIPNLAGAQTKGVQVNLAFEGLTKTETNQWVVATEGRLIQDKPEFSRWIVYESPDAFQLKSVKEIKYPLTQAMGGPLDFGSYVTDLVSLPGDVFLVLERGLHFAKDSKPYAFSSELFVFEKGLKKSLFPLKSLSEKALQAANYEGMTWGPRLSSGERLLLVVSDNNFVRKEDSFIVMFAVKESP